MSAPVPLSRLEQIIDRSRAAARIEAMLPAGIRPRQLLVRTLLIGMLLTLADHRPAHLTRVHQALTSLPETDRIRLGVVAGWKHGPHLLTYRQVERTFHLAVTALAKDHPDGAPSPGLAGILDALLEASIPPQHKDTTRALAVDWSDLETFSRPPSRGSSDCADPEASWGHRRGDSPGQKDELFYGYYLLFAVAQDVHDGDVRRGDGWGVKSPAWRLPGGAVVDRMAAWWSVCRGGFFADGGAGGGFVDDGFPCRAGSQQRGDGEPVDRAGQASCLIVDDAHGII